MVLLEAAVVVGAAVGYKKYKKKKKMRKNRVRCERCGCEGDGRRSLTCEDDSQCPCHSGSVDEAEEGFEGEWQGDGERVAEVKGDGDLARDVPRDLGVRSTSTAMVESEREPWGGGAYMPHQSSFDRSGSIGAEYSSDANREPYYRSYTRRDQYDGDQI